MADPQVNFFSSTLVGGYTDSDTELTLATGSGANLPDPSTDGAFNLVIYNESEIFVTTTFDGGSTDTRQDLASTNPEIVRVTARSGDVLTVARAQEGTAASAKESDNTYRVILASTKKVFDDINDAIANVDLTTLTGVEELTFDSTGDEEFGLPAGTTAQRPSNPSAGYMRWNSTDSRIEFYNGSRWTGLSEIGFQSETMEVAQLSVTANDAEFLTPLEVEYLVIAGGGGGGAKRAGGGGAGGYRTSSGTQLYLSTNYTVTVGAGGAGDTDETGTGSSGSNSVFDTISSAGGGGGGSQDGPGSGGTAGANGGSGGGGSGASGGTGGTGNTPSTSPSQGNDGGDGNSTAGGSGGGGGGASEDGLNGTFEVGGDGGDGVSSSITGSSVFYAGGGGGGGRTGGGTGGQGGGGNGVASGVAPSGTSNTGGGGGGAGADAAGGGSGGSGVVILRYPSNFSITIGAGLTGSETTVGANKVATITAGTGNVSWTTA